MIREADYDDALTNSDSFIPNGIGLLHDQRGLPWHCESDHSKAGKSWGLARVSFADQSLCFAWLRDLAEICFPDSQGKCLSSHRQDAECFL
jgi:hypothetical protein